MKKILLVASVASHIAQFHRPLVDMLHQYGFEIHAAAHNNMELKPGLKLDFIDKFIEVPFVRSVKDPKNVAAYKTIKRVIYSDDYVAIHCNTPIASVLTRLAARDARKHGAKVIYTAHGFQFFNGSSKKDWMIYYNVGGHNEMKNLDIVKLICDALGKPQSLITFVTDRKGHDMRYAIDPTKIHNELGWLPETKFADGIQKTIKWYLDNKPWWETIISGEYVHYYEKMYGNR